MKLWLLGTGTPTPSMRRMCSGYVVKVGGDCIVFDHGFGAHHRLLELGIRPTEVTHAFFSHHHYDHMGDYPRLLLTRWDQGAGKIAELEVFGPPPLRKITEAMIGDEGVFRPRPDLAHPEPVQHRRVPGPGRRRPACATGTCAP